MNPKEGLFRMATNPNPSEAPPEAPRRPLSFSESYKEGLHPESSKPAKTS